MNVRLSKEQKIKVLNSEDVYAVMQQVLQRENKIRRNQEHFWIVGLDHRNKILFIELISLGASNRLQVNPPEVFRMAIYKLAGKVIMVHNHPSGELEPSDADTDLTDRLMKAGQMINIEVIEHLIISETDYLSYADEGIIDRLRHNGLYQLIDREKAELQEMKMEVEKKNAEKAKALTIAGKMKADGFDVEVIKKYTGLRVSEIRKV